MFMRCNTTPPDPITGYAHPKCFARSLNDCSKTISREHYISQSILRLFNCTCGLASGFPWLCPGEQRQVSIESLTGKILCTRHNQALSSLDTVAANFFKFFVTQWSASSVEVYLLRGYDLERWFLKMLCAFVVSGNVIFNGKRLSNWTPPIEWLSILFGSADVIFPSGLHSVAGSYRSDADSFYVNPCFKSNTAQPIALMFAISGISFLFAMEEYPPMKQPSQFGTTVHYRPKVLQICEEEQVREAHFGWPAGSIVNLSRRISTELSDLHKGDSQGCLVYPSGMRSGENGYFRGFGEHGWAG